MDMLRFHNFMVMWKADFGDPDKKEDFEISIANTRHFQYPSADELRSSVSRGAPDDGGHDDRVVPRSSIKSLLSSSTSWAIGQTGEPLLILVETLVGRRRQAHFQSHEEVSDMYSSIAGIKFRI